MLGECYELIIADTNLYQPVYDFLIRRLPFLNLFMGCDNQPADKKMWSSPIENIYVIAVIFFCVYIQ